MMSAWDNKKWLLKGLELRLVRLAKTQNMHWYEKLFNFYQVLSESKL